MHSAKFFLASESGATAIEYALIAVLIFMSILIAVQATGNAVVALFEQVVDGFN